MDKSKEELKKVLIDQNTYDDYAVDVIKANYTGMIEDGVDIEVADLVNTVAMGYIINMRSLIFG